MTREGMPSKALMVRLWPFLVVLGLLVLVTYPTWEGIVLRWFKLDESYSHGFLLVAVALFITARVSRQHPVTPGFAPLWVIPFIICLAVYWVGGLIRLQALQHLVLVPLMFSACVTLMGWRQAKWFLIPPGLVFLTLPVWDFLAWTLQLITVAINKFLLGFFSIDFEVEGVFVYLIGVGTFEVAHGCSGLRYLLVGQALVLIYGELYLSRWRSRLTLFFLGVAFALVANWIRVFVIIYMGYETNMQSSLIEDHDNFGWWVFAGTLVPLYFLARKLEKRDDDIVSGETVSASPEQSIGGNATLAVALIVVLGLGAWISLPEQRSLVSVKPEIYALDASEQFAPIFKPGLEGWRPIIRHPDRVYAQTMFDRQQARDGSGVSTTYYLGAFTYEFQRPRAELIQYSNRLYDADYWIPENFFDVENELGIQVQGVTLKHRVSGQRVHLGYSYLVQGQWETDQWRAKLAQISGFFSGRDDASLLISGVACDACDVPITLGRFVEATFPLVLKQIDREVLKKGG
ncbi:exosortase/archaeosortase family protein [Marinobacter daepoensis]|uniref:exosortase/archaeosortase family protein n=1 Tax=Marinobacter daepoensis TaxID=262077 RepID=UPI0004A49EC2|nr:exosortase/archaeosortase family protein [Marinobacter daepoensis]